MNAYLVFRKYYFSSMLNIPYNYFFICRTKDVKSGKLNNVFRLFGFFFCKKKVVFLVFSCKENISKKKKINKIMNTGFKKKG